MINFSSAKSACAVFLLYVAAAISASAQTFTNLATFDITNGAYPFGALVQGLDGNFYGTTAEGNGRNQCTGGCGEVFKITPTGTLEIIHSFSKTDGGYPLAGLVLATNGNFYGGTNGCSPYTSTCVPFFFFEMTPEGTLMNFSTSFATSSAMIQDSVNSNLYGTIGATDADTGSIFEMTPGGVVSTLYNFEGSSNPGAPLTSLVQGKDGFLYGTTLNGGDTKTSGPCQTTGCGMVFEIGLGGHLAVRHMFDSTDGNRPMAGLIQGSDGNFYGTTSVGGTFNVGTVFKITPAGVLTTLYNFVCSAATKCADGQDPQSGLVQATDGNFYGTTYLGGVNGYGTVFQITPEGTLTTLHTFTKIDGGYPQGGLAQGTDGNLYGVTTGFPGAKIYGTVFQLSMGLGSFVKTIPTAAYPGTTIFILGTDLTGATSVTFNGKAAAFTVVSPTEITATVPKGSTAGMVEVVTPSGTLSSNVPFKVF